MSRLPTVTRDDLSAEHHHAWDEIARTHRGNVNGPFSALIHVPPMGLRVSELEAYFRFEGQLAAADRELIVCAVTKHHGAAFPYAIHDNLAREAGTAEAARNAVASGAATKGLPLREALLIEIARTLCEESTLPPALYERAKAELGEKVLVEAVTLCGHYTMISFVANSFDIQAAGAGHR
jgi:4-carboxymuconolactone decarboxylase